MLIKLHLYCLSFTRVCVHLKCEIPDFLRIPLDLAMVRTEFFELPFELLPSAALGRIGLLDRVKHGVHLRHSLQGRVYFGPIFAEVSQQLSITSAFF